MKDTCRPGSDSQSQEHVSDLADGGVSQDPFYIPLGETAETGQQQSGRAQDRHDHHYRRCQGKQHVGAGNQINTGGNHGGRMDKGTYRGGARHGIGQPCLQRQLGGFADRPSQQEQRGRHRQGRTRRPCLCGPCHELLNLEGIQPGEKQKQADGHSRIPHAGDDERLAGSIAVFRFRIPEADKQIAA